MVLPAGHRGPAFLVYENFETILIWNRSILYALSVGHLADRIAGAPPLSAAALPDEEPLSLKAIEEMQALLNARGYDAGDRKSGVQGKSVSVRVARGGSRIIKKKKHNQRLTQTARLKQDTELAYRLE